MLDPTPKSWTPTAMLDLLERQERRVREASDSQLRCWALDDDHALSALALEELHRRGARHGRR
jgi:hypothetical protein